jgi:hypothetical protein
VLALGIGGFFLLRSKTNSTANSSSTAGAHSAVTPANGGITPTAKSGNTPATSVNSSEQLNLKLTYASVAITLVSAQKATTFTDDTSTSGPGGVVRINLQENNTTTSNPDYAESGAMLLVLPDGNTVQPGNSFQLVSPAAGVNRQNWIDFPLTTAVPLSQLTLRIGKGSENQMTIPLQPGTDISKYQDKTSNPNAQFQYAGVHWTLKTATLSYSYADQQATTGNRYVIVTLAAANNTSNEFVGAPSSYIRLQTSGNSVQPDSSYTLPTSVGANTTASGIIAFLVPQNATSFTLVMLAQAGASPAISQVTQNFQIT